MNKTLLFFLLLSLSPLLYPQQIELEGRVSLHNSRYTTGQIEYVPNAAVSASFAGSTRSDATGSFNLVFVGIAAGLKVEVTVEKAGLKRLWRSWMRPSWMKPPKRH